MIDDRPLFVRLPGREAEMLERAAFALELSKKDLVTALVARHVDPSSEQGLDRLREALVVEPGRTVVGRHAFQPAPAPEVLTLAEVAELLQADEDAALALAEAGELPGRRIGEKWRFSRAAVLAWLSAG